MKLFFYGRLAEAIGPELEISVPAGCSVAELRDRIAADYPQVRNVLESRRARACIADRLVDDTYRVETGDRLEFLPPVSGG